jgi:protein gp37
MGETTAISWTDHTFNPWIGCSGSRPAASTATPRPWTSDGVKKLRWGPTAPRVRTSPANWKQPLKWNRKAAAEGVRRRVFCASMADVFEDRAELVPWRSDLFDLIQATPWLDWLLLTKRPENLPRMLPVWGGAFANIWLGTTVEDQQRANERIPALLAVPAAVHFLSCEPLLEHVHLRRRPLRDREARR